MFIPFATVFLCLFIIHNALSKRVDYLIKPGTQVGLIRANTSEKDLHRIFGLESVLDWDILIGEGESIPGTVVKAKDQPCTIGIIWKDTVNKKKPKEVRFHGSGCKWKTKEGVTLGMSLQELEQINGKPFKLTGFAWDYGGTFMSSDNGKLSFLDRIPDADNKPISGKMLIRLQPKFSETDSSMEDTFLSVSGDELFESQNPAMQKLNPVVNELIIYFP